MGKTISRIDAVQPTQMRRKRVAAYARISMITDRLSHSLSSQISQYSKLIQSNSEWEFAGVYADNGISGGSSENRREFQRMLKACDEGKIDIILTKSISRFARNTVDTLTTVRHLRDIGVEVRFEKEGISSFGETGELMLSLYASFAQEESRSLSENIKWAVRKRFEKGIPCGRFPIFGYRWEGNHLVVHPEEAAIVRLIYDNYLNGLSAETTEKQLADMGVKSYTGGHFGNSSIRRILNNITYTGNLLLQKEYIVDPLTGKSKINRGELPQYWVENTHEAIIPMEVYEAVQAEKKRRRELGVFANWSIRTTCFTSKIRCPHCQKNYMFSRRTKNGRVSEYWVCGTQKKKKVGDGCPVGGTINHTKLMQVCTQVLGLDAFDETVFLERVDHIEVPRRYTLVFYMKDGTVIERACPNTGHRDCWTPEYRAAVSKRRMGTYMVKAHQNPYTGYVKCPVCGVNFHKQTRKYKDGTKKAIWVCPNRSICGNRAQPTEEVLKHIIAEAIGIQEFDEATFHAQIEEIRMTGEFEATLKMRDGRLVVKTWERIPRKTYPHTDAYRQRMSQLSKERWADDEYRKRVIANIKKARSGEK